MCSRGPYVGLSQKGNQMSGTYSIISSILFHVFLAWPLHKNDKHKSRNVNLSPFKLN